jgi:uncharacterized protein YdeI (YjbR/CyaY-like superfamily)
MQDYIIVKKHISLKRPTYPIPVFIMQALEKEGLTEAYNSRPPYQQNDYIHWITSPKHEKTKQKRLNQMLSELQQGGVYMKMNWNPAR